MDLLSSKEWLPWTRLSLLTGCSSPQGGDTEVKEEILKEEELLARVSVSVLPVNFPC